MFLIKMCWHHYLPHITNHDNPNIFLISEVFGFAFSFYTHQPRPARVGFVAPPEVNDLKDKTNVMRILDSLKLPYSEHSYAATDAISGVEVAKALGQAPERVFKTLVTTGKTGAHYVFMIPVAEELDLKKAATQVGEKSIEMLKSKDLLALTGYVHGGCSPIGMKKFFATTIHQTAKGFETIIFSGGKIGWQIELGLEALGKAVRFTLGDLIK